MNARLVEGVVVKIAGDARGAAGGNGHEECCAGHRLQERLEVGVNTGSSVSESERERSVETPAI